MTESDDYPGSTGIYFDFSQLCYRAQLCYRGHIIHVGLFDDLEEAKRARDRMKKIYGSSKIPPRPQNKFDTCQNPKP